uniref:integrase core domain-containing protein n=1 Tax=Oceanithermus sp. TaxID=2268145 RepID=UPI0025F349A5
GHAYDNARMERAIGTLKREYGIEGPFPTEGDAAIAVKEAIRLYNHHRPHWALALATPAQVYFGCGKGGG